MSWERLGVEFLLFFLCVAAMLFAQLDFSRPVTGLLGRPAAFRDFFQYRDCCFLLAVCGCRLLVKLDLFQGLALACSVGLVILAKWDLL